MDDEISDILGQQTKPVLRTNNNQHWLGASLTVKLVFGLAILLVLYVVAMRIWIRVLVWKERSYKLAMRRRHGIPDNDHRPFNVAYAAVVRSRQEKDAAQRAKTKATQPLLPHDRRNAQSEQNVRQRFGIQTTIEPPRASSYSARVPGAFHGPEGTPARSSPQYTGLSVSPVSVTIPTRSHTQPQRVAPQQLGNDIKSLQNAYRRPSRKELALGDAASSHKRGFVEDPSDEQEVAKKSKWENGHTGDEPDGVVAQPQRGAKRYLGYEDEFDDDPFERQPRDKRARKVSLEKAIQVQEDDSEMEVDEEDDDDIDDLPSFRRGKKRDRAEAGSTFGGDDLDPDNPDPSSKRRTRIRRTVSKRKSDIAILVRGQKRDRDSEGDESEVEGGDDIPYISRKKRGKKALLPDEIFSEESTNNSRASSASRSRKIGEEWSSNGIKWKVGPNGQRLRQALVKKSRQRFPMPEDSQHPDRDVDFEVFVETWLTEEEYRDAKAQHALAWQDSPKRSGEPEKLAVDVRSPAVGKNLLWSSTSTPVGSPATYSPSSDYPLSSTHRAQRDPFRSSTTSAVGLRINPFDQPSIQSGRRISSIIRSISTGSTGSPSLTDSTNSSPHTRFKTYSKFEKQELEAQAILKLRELKNKKENEANRAKEDQERVEKERAEKERAEKENFEKAKMAATPPPMVPTITVTAPPEAPKPQPVSVLARPASDPPKPAEASQPPPLFASAIPAFTTPKPSETPANTSAPATSFFATAPPIASSAGKGSSLTSHFHGFPPQAAAPTTAGTDSSKAGSSTESPSLFSSPSALGINMNPPPAVAAQPNTAKPRFTFGVTASKPLTEQKTLESTLPSDPQSTNNPLLARLGSSINNTSTPATNPTSSPAASQSMTAFPTSKPATQFNPFNMPTSQVKTAQGSLSTAAPTSATTTAAPKFNFGFANPTNTASTAIPLGPSSTSTPSQIQPTSKPAPQPLVNFVPLTATGAKDSNESATNNTTSTPPLFSFKTPTAPTTTTSTTAGPPNVTASGTPSGALQFSFAAPNGTSSTTSFNPFGTPGTASAFGASSFGKPAENRPAESSGTVAAKPLFSFGMTPGQPPNAAPTSGLFGTGTTAPKPPPSSSSLFGALDPQLSTTFGAFTSTNNSGALVASTGAGGSTGGFGTTTAAPSSQPISNTGPTTNQPVEASKTSFSFAPPTTMNGNVTTKPADAPKPLFNFSAPTTANGVGATSSSGPSSGSNFSFNFSAPSKDTTAPTTPQTSPFAAKPGTFTFGVPATTNTTSGAQVFSGFGAAQQK